jgi:hypothetical protein
MRGMVTRITFLTILVLLGSACSSTYRAYSGPEQPGSQTASITSHGEQPGRFAVDYYHRSIVRTDDLYLPFGTLCLQLDLLPNRHCVKLALHVDALHMFSDEVEQPDPICIDMEAGHIYHAKSGYDVKNNRHLYWIVDTADDHIVAGEGPPTEPIQDSTILED